MLTYTTLEGRVLDLSALTDELRSYFEECWQAYLAGEDSIAFENDRVFSARNPLLRETGGLITRVALDSPLYPALRDLGSRLGIAQGRFKPHAKARPDVHPLESDEWLTVPEAARRKGVTVQGLHNAIKRGDVIAHPAKEGGSWLRVSRNSLDAWQPNPRRQAAGRARHRQTTTV
jgi:hypothetical protein